MIAAWLGVIALGCNGLVPIRFAFELGLDIAHRGQCGHYEGAPVRHDAGWWMLVLLTGQDQTADPLRSHKGLHPAVNAPCGAIGSFTAFTPAVTALLTPLIFKRALALPIIEAGTPPLAFIAGYRSRAPPLA